MPRATSCRPRGHSRSRSRFAVAFFSLACLAPSAAQVEPWSMETLEQQVADFNTENWVKKLEPVAKLVAAPPAWPTLQQVVYGDHREYMVKIRTLLQGLTNERWLERERAERTLVEVGARARDFLREQAKAAETLEERDRIQRALERIEARGTADEDRRLKLLRGLVFASLYLPTTDGLRRALVSAMGHNDSTVVNHALRAMGRHGREEDVAALVRHLELTGTPHRLTALCALARIDAPAARAALLRLIDEDKVDDVEQLHILRVSRANAGAAPVLAKLAASPRPIVSAACKLTLPAAGAAPRCQVSLSDRSTLECPFTGLAGDAVELRDPIPGLAYFEAPLASVAQVQLREAPKVTAPARVFLLQGSLLTGTLEAIDAEWVKLTGKTLGAMTIPRAQVQGILLAADLDRLIGNSATTDRLRLADKSLLDADVVRCDGKVLVARDAAKGEVAHALDTLSGILFRRPPSTSIDTTQYTRAVLNSGDRALGHIVGTSCGSVAFVVPGAMGQAPLCATVIPCTEIASLEFLVSGGASWGYTMVADYSDNRLVELDEKGKEVYALDDVFGAWDVECLENGNLLVTEFSVNRVQEVTRKGAQVWVFEDLKNPYDADRLPNGNTLIADTFGGRVIEVDRTGKIVWQYATDVRPFDCERLPNGNTLIADVLKERVIEVTYDGQIAWQLDNMKLVHDADRLPNGNTLITLREAKKVIEVDRDGQVVFELKNLSHPSDADRLPNGNTIVAENGMVREFDRGGNEVWRREMTWAVEVNRY